MSLEVLARLSRLEAKVFGAPTADNAATMLLQTIERLEDARVRLIKEQQGVRDRCLQVLSACYLSIPEGAMVYSEGTHGDRVYVKPLLREAILDLGGEVPS